MSILTTQILLQSVAGQVPGEKTMLVRLDEKSGEKECSKRLKSKLPDGYQQICGQLFVRDKSTNPWSTVSVCPENGPTWGDSSHTNAKPVCKELGFDVDDGGYTRFKGQVNQVAKSTS